MPLQKKVSLNYTESPGSPNVSIFGRKWSNIVISEGSKFDSNETVSCLFISAGNIQTSAKTVNSRTCFHQSAVSVNK